MSRSNNLNSISSLLRQHAGKFKLRLARNGLIAYESRTATAIRLDRQETEKFLSRRIDFEQLDDFCEVVHLEISAKCQLDCAYCYNRVHPTKELSTTQLKAVIHDLAGYGVFQVTFGGGEPTLREDLKDLAEYVRCSGLNLCMTTNGVELSRLGSSTLRLFNQINVSYHHAAGRNTVLKALQHLRDVTVVSGINFLLTEEYAQDIDEVVGLAREFDAELLMLSAKGVAHALPPEDVLTKAKELHQQGVSVAVDSLSCKNSLADYCLQKIRFCTVDSIGNVLPCSFIREPMGNLLKQPFIEIWRSRGKQVSCPYVHAGATANSA